MLLITLKRAPTAQLSTRELEYTISEDQDHLHSKIADDEKVLEVLATGDELSYIIRNMRAIPYNQVRDTGHWTGDLATFIVDNW